MKKFFFGGAILLGSIVVVVLITIFFQRESDIFNSNDLAQKESLSPTIYVHPCERIDFDKGMFVNSEWQFPGYNEDRVAGKITLNSDSFTFSGYESDSFVSSGTWSFNPDKQSIKLVFKDNKDYWSTKLSKEDLADYQQFTDTIIDMGQDPYYIELKIVKSGFSPETRCDLNVNFLGWTYTYQANQ